MLEHIRNIPEKKMRVCMEFFKIYRGLPGGIVVRLLDY